MQYPQIVSIQPMQSAYGIYEYASKMSTIEVSKNSSLIKKTVVSIANVSKSVLLAIALTISMIFAAVYSLISYPFRAYRFYSFAKTSIDRDLSRLTPNEQKETRKIIEDYFKKHETDLNYTPDQRDKTIRFLTSQCARSMKGYGPVVRSFVDHLLENASKENTKLIFMARDGTIFYKVAKKLMKTDEYKEKYPNLSHPQSIVLAHFSRKMIQNANKSKEASELFQRYVTEELGIKNQDQCQLIDIGFFGSMISAIKKLLPNVRCDFKFLVSITKEADGFLGTFKNPLTNLKIPQHNLGRGWIEENHSGTLASAQHLYFDKEKGQIMPDSRFPQKKRVKDAPKFSLNYLIRKFCLERTIHYATSLSLQSDEEKSLAKRTLSQVLGDINSLKLPVAQIGDFYFSSKQPKLKI